MNQLGDMIFSLPLIYNLRKAYQKAEIISIGTSSEILKTIAQLSALIDEVLIRPKGINIFRKLHFITKCKEKKFDISIHISQSLDATLLAYICNIPQRIGFKSAMMSQLYTTRVNFEKPPSTFNNLKLIEVLDIPVIKKDYVGLLSVELDRNFFKKIGISENDFIVAISPATSKRRKYKMWYSDRFAEVIKYLIDNYKAKCFLLGSMQDYITCFEILAKVSDNNVVNLSGKTSLLDVTKIIKRANIFIGVDSGLLHVASALDVPVIGLYGKTLPQYIGPQNEKKVIIKKDNMKEITSEEVIQAVKFLIKST